jgi:membrane-bound lytic murein transglycosylase B
MRRSLSALILPALIPVVLVAAIPAPAAPAHEPAASNFEGFLQELWADAQAQGIARATFDTAFAGLAPDPRVIAATSRQPEYGKPAGDYVNSIASRGRIDAGIQQVRKWSDTFAAVEKKFGIERWVLLGLWGIETSYGADKDRWDVIRSLATLAQARYRDPYFRNELLVALRILQDGHVARQKLVGSWAGAMGQPQFMPSNFYDYAVDFSGNGRPDIWTNVPDVLASMANYLRKEGWSPGLTWGFEVIVPTDFDYRRSRASLQNWSELGLRRADGGAFPQAGDAILFFPSGAAGPAFLVTTNFSVIKRYNDSDIYALAVLHLADRISGRAPIRAAWPADDRQLSRADRIALQRKLAELGYAVRDFEAHFDFDLRDAVREVQAKFGMRPDGHPTPALLERLGVR